jgi:hypothetical protein
LPSTLVNENSFPEIRSLKFTGCIFVPQPVSNLFFQVHNGWYTNAATLGVMSHFIDGCK